VGALFALAGGRNFTTAGSFTNNGTLNVGSGSTFDVNGSLTNFSGNTLANGTYIVGGTLQFNGANIVTNAASLTLNGAASQVIDQSSVNGLANLATNTGTFVVGAGRSFTTSGSFTNSGTFTVGTGGIASTFLVGGPSLTNSGTVNLGANSILGAASTGTLTNNGTILGGGTLGNNTLSVLNNGTINANLGGTLLINPNASGFNNAGNLLVNSGSTLDITGPSNSFLNFNSGTGTLTGGNYTVLGTLQFDNANIATNAASITLLGPASQIINQSSVNALANFATNAAGGSFTLAGGRNFTTATDFSNNGNLVVDGGSKFTVNGNLTNFSGTTLTGGTYALYGGVLQANNANIVTNAANITLSGPTAQFIDGSSHNALANFTTNAGSFNLQGGQNLTTVAGSFTNSGFLAVGSGSTLTIGNGGTTSIPVNYTQTAGLTVVDGTLTFTATSAGTPTLSVNGGSLFGTGTLSYSSVVDAGALSPGDSATQTGKLGVTGAYTQAANGNLGVSIGGSTAGTNYDQLNVGGASTLSGTLNISTINSYVPALGSTFDILHAGSVSGTFAAITGAGINGSEHYSVTYNGTDVILTVVSGVSVVGRNRWNRPVLVAGSFNSYRSTGTNLARVGLGRLPQNYNLAGRLVPSWATPILTPRLATSRGQQMFAQFAAASSLSHAGYARLIKPATNSFAPATVTRQAARVQPATTSAHFSMRGFGLVAGLSAVGPQSRSALALSPVASPAVPAALVSPAISSRGEFGSAGVGGGVATALETNGAADRADPAAMISRNGGPSMRGTIGYHVDLFSLRNLGPKHLLRDLITQPDSSKATSFGRLMIYDGH
jgi:hypothetical protein